MALPVVKECPANTWVLVATAVQKGQIWIQLAGTYVHTYVPTGGAAPANDTLAAPLCDPSMAISALEEIDVYVKCRNAAGRVRVDL